MRSQTHPSLSRHVGNDHSTAIQYQEQSEAGQHQPAVCANPAETAAMSSSPKVSMVTTLREEDDFIYYVKLQ